MSRTYKLVSHDGITQEFEDFAVAWDTFDRDQPGDSDSDDYWESLHIPVNDESELVLDDFGGYELRQK